MSYGSWGRLHAPTNSAVHIRWADAIPRPPDTKSLLPYGNGRSYGDSCLNEDGWLLDARGLDRFRSFDPVTGILVCEGGVLLTEILALIAPKNWFLPVTPGTQYVTVGGAIANDVHGKNHHRTGTFGHHVRRLALWRSDNTVTICSPSENADLFHGTIGGLGLTGLILWAELQLMPIASQALRVDTQRFGGLREFFALSQESDADFEYTVAWIDCLARGRALGRGVFWRANHAPAGSPTPRPPRRSLSMPWTPPIPLVNRVSLRAFNSLLYRKTSPQLETGYRHYVPFFYPLDRIKHWNRMYGPQGFFQYQCVVPQTHSLEAIAEILHRIAKARAGSFLAVLKVFGDRPPAGLLSFSRPGATFALDFPNKGIKTRILLDQLDQVVDNAGGAVYPAKDARLTPQSFQRAFPAWRELAVLKDPHFSSSFWRRVTGTP